MTFLTPAELRRILKFSKSTEHRLLKNGMPALSSGRLRRYDEAAVVEWFRTHNYSPPPNLAATMLLRMNACESADTPKEV